jgi:lysophospholipase L1-like esterase
LHGPEFLTMNLPRMNQRPWCARKEGMALLLLAFLFCYYFNFEESEDPFSTPFCDKDGTCHEKPDKPSPRTIYSARNKWQYDLWWKCNAELNEMAKAYAQRRTNSEGHVRSLVLLGDSITESWLGTGLGQEKHRSKGVPEVLKEKFKDYDPVVLAISGDQTQHLLYRIHNGQLPSGEDEDAIFVVMIGTNNIGSGELPGPTAKGVLAVAEHVLNNTKGHLVLFQVLPRGDGSRVLPELCPPRCSSSGKSFESFMPAVNKINEGISKGMDALKEQYGVNRLGLVQCGSRFVGIADDSEVEKTLMPDLLHPNAAGHQILADCILDYINTSINNS